MRGGELDVPGDTLTGHEKSLGLGDEAYWRRNLFRRVVSDQKFLVTRWWPAELRSARFAVPMVIGIAGAVSGREGTGFDQSLEADARSSGRGAQGVAQGLTRLGNGVTVGAFLGSLYLAGRWRGNQKLMETSSLSAEALLDAGIWVTVLKAATARTRPVSGGRGDFFEYQTKGSQVNGSFPSGHAMGAFAVATVLAHEYRGKRWVPWTAYGAASLIAYSRLTLGRHFPSDVIVGAALGNSIGRMVFARAHGETADALSRIQPIYDPVHRSYGVGWSYSW